ncbi:T9SS type A sorting domain-containing protein [Hymenobacter crusticola]|nr:T9SS type A sorting domain-containing protein [Hymenobacter crusticola]
MTFRYSSLFTFYQRCLLLWQICLLYIVFLSIIPLKAVQAQTWRQALNGNSYQPPNDRSRYDSQNPGTSLAYKTAIDVQGNVFVTGTFTGIITFGTTRLTSVNPMSRYGNDVFVAKWDVAAQDWAWAVSGGGDDDDIVNGIAVSGNNVYVTGSFLTGSNTRYAGTTLVGTGDRDIFLAKYIDNGTSVSNGWAIREGGVLNDEGTGVAVNGSTVYVTGFFVTDPFSLPDVTIAGTVLTNVGIGSTADLFVAKYTDTGRSVRGAGAASGGSVTSSVFSTAIAVSGNRIYVTGWFTNQCTVAGTRLTATGNSFDVFIAKYTDTGSGFNNGWAISEGGPDTDRSTDIAVSGNNVYVTGQFEDQASFAGTWLDSEGFQDMFVAKYVDEGTSVSKGWATSGGGYQSDIGSGITVSGEQVYVTGTFAGASFYKARFAGTTLVGHDDNDLFVVQYIDKGMSFRNGWVTSGGSAPISGGYESDAGYAIAVSAGKVYVAGQTGSDVARFGTVPELLAPRKSAILGRLEAGTGTWQQVEGPLQGGISSCTSTAADASGNVFVTGSFTGTVGFGTFRLTSVGGSDMFLAKWNAPTATWVWASRAGGSTNDIGYKVVLEGNNVYVTGSFTNRANFAGTWVQAVDSSDVFVVKYIDNGTTIGNGWAISAGGSGNDAGQGLAVNASNVYVTGHFASGHNAYIAGQALSGAGNQDVFVAKYTDTGLSVQNGWAISGGGTRKDDSHAVTVSGTNVYITGEFTSNTSAVLSGTELVGAGYTDLFVAKYVDEGSSVRNGWAVSGGGSRNDYSYDVSANGRNVYVTGEITNTYDVRVAGTLLTAPVAAGSWLYPDPNLFVAKYIDEGSMVRDGWATSGRCSHSDGGRSVVVSGSNVYVTGYLTDGTFNSSYPVIAGTTLIQKNGLFVAKYVDGGTSFRNGWAAIGGDADAVGYGLAVQENSVYVAGGVTDEARYGPFELNTISGHLNFLGQLTDDVVLATRQAIPSSKPTGLQVFPNPTRSSATLHGATPGAAVQVLDALGRIVVLTMADSLGAAHLPTGLPAGVYTVRAADRATRLVIE